MKENNPIKDLYEACLEKDKQIILVMEGKISLLTEENKALKAENERIDYFQAIIDELKDEINALKRIIAKELTENDELGREYTYVTCLKDKFAQLKSELSKKDSDIKEIIAIVHEHAEAGNILYTDFLFEKLERF